jgi:hypothetical protein
MELPEIESLASTEVELPQPQGSKNSASASRPVAFDKLWRVATIEKHGIGQLFGVPVRDNETEEEILRKLQTRFGKRKFEQYLNKIFLLRSQAVFVGNISKASVVPLEPFFRSS